MAIASTGYSPYPIIPNPANPQNPQKVGCYQDLLGGKTITVYSVQRQLFATIDDHAQDVPSFRLELVGVPKELTRETDLQKLTTFFSNTHLIPERGVNGINRVSVHVSADGGMRAGIPFQPGLALGTIVRGDSIARMEEYAKEATIRQRLEDQIHSTEQQIEVLQTKIQSRAKKNIEDDPLIHLWTTEITANQELIKEVSTKLKAIPKPMFDDFQQGIESPIDFKNSTFEVQKRGFDSMTFSSQYINLQEDLSAIHDKIEQSSNSTSVSLNGGNLFWDVKGDISHSKAVLNRLSQMKAEKKTEGILLINSNVTTRNVRTISDVKYDLPKLKMLLDIMKNGEEEVQKRYGISTLNENQKCIYLLTEAVLGGSFTAIVTFLDQSTSDRDLKKGQTQRNTSGSLSGSANLSVIKGGGKIAHTNASASENEDDVLKFNAQTRVNIEYMSQGALPALNRHNIEREILKHANLDPSKYELSSTDEKDAEDLVKTKGQEQEIALMKIEMKRQKAKEATLNHYRGLAVIKQTQNIHTEESAIDAFESFTQKITEDEDCGVPIGFFYKVLTQNEIERIIGEHSRVGEG